MRFFPRGKKNKARGNHGADGRPDSLPGVEVQSCGPESNGACADDSKRLRFPSFVASRERDSTGAKPDDITQEIVPKGEAPPELLITKYELDDSKLRTATRDLVEACNHIIDERESLHSLHSTIASITGLALVISSNWMPELWSNRACMVAFILFGWSWRGR